MSIHERHQAHAPAPGAAAGALGSTGAPGSDGTSTVAPGSDGTSTVAPGSDGTSAGAPGSAGAPAVTAPEAVAGTAAKSRLFTWPLLIGVLVTAALVASSLFIGVYDIFGAEDGSEMFAITRVPRTIALVLAGAAMAMCGLVMQLLTQNRFVEPTTTGTTEWAGLGLLLAFIAFPGAPLIVTMSVAIITAFIGTLIFFAFLRRVTLKSSLIVPIIGLMFGAVVGAISTFLALQNDLLQTVGIWFAGSFTAVLRGQYEPLWFVLIVVIAVFIVADRFTVAGLGQEIATNVGLNYNQVLLLGTGLIAIATGIVTVVVGNLPFIGLIVPNIVSLFRGDDLRSNLPWVCLLGIAIVTICDIIGRTIVAPFEIPVSLILAVVGAAVFITLLLRRRRNG